MDSEGNVVGHLQQLGGATALYQVVAICTRTKHNPGKGKKECTRMRGWRHNKGEEVTKVDWVCARWLLRGADYDSKDDHRNKDPRE